MQVLSGDHWLRNNIATDRSVAQGRSLSRLNAQLLSVGSVLGVVCFSLTGAASILWWFEPHAYDTIGRLSWGVQNVRLDWPGWGERALLVAVAAGLAAPIGVVVARGNKYVRRYAAVFPLITIGAAIYAKETFSFTSFGPDIPAFMTGPSVLWTFLAIGSLAIFIGVHLTVIAFSSDVRKQRTTLGLASLLVLVVGGLLSWYGALHREGI